jgi:phage baseplate assembly protein W
MSTSLHTRTTIDQTKTPPQRTIQRYRGFSTVSTATQNYALYDFELIKQDLLNNFYVRQGERLMNPEYGTVIWDILFEPLTEEIKSLILRNVNQIFNADPRVQAGNIIITPYDQGLQIQCTLVYLLYNLQEALQLNFDRDNGLLITQ